MSAPSAPDVGRDLLAYLRSVTDQVLVFSEPPVRFSAGVESRVYGFRVSGGAGDLDGPLVLKVFGGQPDPQRARVETVLCNTLAELGFAAPRVLHTCPDAGPLGAPFVIMERLPGHVMLEPLTSTRSAGNGLRLAQMPAVMYASIFRMPRVVGSVMARLHALDARVLRRRLEEAQLDPGMFSLDARLAALRDRSDGAPLGGLAQAVRWLEERRPVGTGREAICHGDLWYGNILELDGRVTGVLDWTMALLHIGDPAYDVGVSSMTLQAGVADVPRAFQSLARRIQPSVAARFVKSYARQMPLDREALRYYQMLRCVEFLEWVARRRVDPAMRSRDEPDLLDLPEQPKQFIAHFLRETGIALTMPPPSGG